MGSISAGGAIAIEWALLSLALIFVLLRVYVRWWLQGHLSLSDLFVVLAFLMGMTSNIADIFSWEYGLWDNRLIFGGPIPTAFTTVFPPGDEARKVRALKIFYWSGIPYYICLYCVKASFIMFYLVLFPKSLRKLRIALWITIVLTAVGFLTMIFSNFFWCIPISSNWAAEPEKECLASASEGPYFITVAFHIITDLSIYILPFFLLRHLYLSRRKVIGLVVLFSLGGICVGSSIARIVLVGTGNTLILFGAVSAGEIASGIIVACLPPLKWLYHSFKYSRQQGIGGSGSGGSGSVEDKEKEGGMGDTGHTGSSGTMFSRKSGRKVIISALDPEEFGIRGHDDDGASEMGAVVEEARVEEGVQGRVMRPAGVYIRRSGSRDIDQEQREAERQVDTTAQ